MAPFIEPQNAIDNVQVAIVISRYNVSVTEKLLEGATRTLEEQGVSAARISIAWVPGAWEIPLVAKRLAASAAYDAILCLGAVIRGETSHNEHINRQVSLSLGQIAIDYEVPVLFGLLTCDSLEQALNRAGGAVGNKGVECALAAIEMIRLLRAIPTKQ